MTVALHRQFEALRPTLLRFAIRQLHNEALVTGKNSMGLRSPCKEVHRLEPEGLDRNISMIERARMHVPVCAAYRNFAGQMQLIRRAMGQLPVADESGTEREPE